MSVGFIRMMVSVNMGMVLPCKGAKIHVNIL
jgi:hypothetical protein